MKKNLHAAWIPASLFFMVFLFSSCFKDDCRRTYKLFIPVYKNLTEIRAQVQSTSAQPVVNAGKMYIRGNWIFLNELKKGIHVIDNSNPSHPVKVSFIKIPGNIDMYVKGTTLYADLYCDLLAANITDPKHIAVSKYLTNTFPDKSVYTTSANPDSIKVITDWIVKDTTVDCNVASGQTDTNCPTCGSFYSATSQTLSSTSKAATDAAGSMARFAAVDNYMYAVTTRDMNIIDITDASNPLFLKRKSIGWDIETIFPYNNKLFIGAGSNMSVYSLQDPANPLQETWNGHWCSRDPVVADDKYAYVTLHEANFCGSKINQLEIYDLSNPDRSLLVKEYPLTNPLGLSKDGDLLFICDDGLKIFDAADVRNIKLLKHLKVSNSYDVIADNGIAYVSTKDGLYQYDYTNPENIRLLSKLLK